MRDNQVYLEEEEEKFIVFSGMRRKDLKYISRERMRDLKYFSVKLTRNARCK